MLAAGSFDFWQFMGSHKDAFSAIESVFKTLAIIVGGWWAIKTFWRKREKYPKAKVVHSVKFWDLSETERAVRVGLCVDNTGEVLLEIAAGFTWIQQMLPPPDRFVEAFAPTTGEQETKPSPELAWPLIEEKEFSGRKEVEPSESDEFGMEFIVPKYYEQIMVYSYLENGAKPGQNIGWTVTTVVNFSELSLAGKTSGETQDESEVQAGKKPRPERASLRKEKGKKH